MGELYSWSEVKRMREKLISGLQVPDGLNQVLIDTAVADLEHEDGRVRTHSRDFLLRMQEVQLEALNRQVDWHIEEERQLTQERVAVTQAAAHTAMATQSSTTDAAKISQAAAHRMLLAMEGAVETPLAPSKETETIIDAESTPHVDDGFDVLR